MILDVDCQNIMLNNFMYIVKNIMNIILIVSPILLILSLTITLTKMASDPDEKKNPKKIWNAIKALVIIFFIPLLVNIVMRLIGNDTEISSCYNNAKKPSAMVKYIEEENEKKKKIISDPDDYEKGVAKQLEFECKSSIVKSQFSCETLKIVEQHLNDFTESNFKSVIASAGGFDNYAKSLGGVFTEFYGAKPQVTTAYELQRVSEYVFGFMYMYGFDYKNGIKAKNKYCKWGGGCEELGKLRSGKTIKSSSSDAFLPGTKIHDSDDLSDRKHFDILISDKDEINMTTNCNWTVDMVFYKAGIFGTGRTNVDSSSGFKKMARKNKLITDFKDFRPGDLIHFFDEEVDPTNPNTWTKEHWKHVAFVGEVDLEKHTATIYEGGGYFIKGRNFKKVIKTDKTTKGLAGWEGWGAVRVIELN